MKSSNETKSYTDEELSMDEEYSMKEEEVNAEQRGHLQFNLHINTRTSGPRASVERLLDVLKRLNKKELRKALQNKPH